MRLIGLLALTLVGSGCTPGVGGNFEEEEGVFVPRPGADAGVVSIDRPPPRRDGGAAGSLYDPVLVAQAPPPAISGGTLRLLSDGRTAVASDPDRDQVYVVDLVRQKLVATVPLQPGDEPGRLVEDGAGRVHVVLRRAGAVASVDLRTGALADRRPVCPAPRGIAHDRTRGLLHVACAGGELVSLPQGAGEPVRRLELERDLRDVVVLGDRLYVSVFRRAEVLVLDAAGQVRARSRLPQTRSVRSKLEPNATASPSVAWRMLENPGKPGVVLLHQRGADGMVGLEPGGYGGHDCGSILETAVTPVAEGVAPPETPALGGVNLGVDLAVAPGGDRVAIVSPGNARRAGAQVAIYPLGAAPGCTGPVGPPDPGPESPVVDEVPPPSAMRQPAGEATAVAFDRRGNVVVQTRQPAALEILTQPGAIIPLSLESRADTGHAIFHSNPNAAVTCASCHPEGGEDGRVWKFARIGPRRTQSLRGGIMKTAPFHWDGDMRDLGHLMHEVFAGRMTGPPLEPRHLGALERWLDALPLLPQSPPRDPGAVARGGALFHSAAVGCATCHGGPLFTNNTTVDVGTRGMFQVPPLVGLAWRAPYMHDGCAPTLRDRFGPCGGDDRHGVISKLSPAQIADLVAYLESL